MSDDDRVSPEEWANILEFLPPQPCTTAPNKTGVRCTCAYDCENHWMRARGLNAPDKRKNWLRRLFS